MGENLSAFRDLTYNEDRNWSPPRSQKISANNDEENSLNANLETKKKEEQEENEEKIKNMRIVCISDTHNEHKKLTEELKKLKKDDKNWDNILIHSGDMTNDGREEKLQDVLNWFEELKFDYTLFIAGNMDGIGLDSNIDDNYQCWTSWGNKYTNKKELTDEKNKIYYLENSSKKINGYKFYGLPHTPKFFGGFQLSSKKECENIYGKIDSDTDILISHGPIYGVFDKTSIGRRVGCKELKNHIKHKLKLRGMIFGHVHSSHNVQKIENTWFINCALHDKIFDDTNRQENTSHMFPIVIDIDKEKDNWVVSRKIDNEWYICN